MDLSRYLDYCINNFLDRMTEMVFRWVPAFFLKWRLFEPRGPKVANKRGQRSLANYAEREQLKRLLSLRPRRPAVGVLRSLRPASFSQSYLLMSKGTQNHPHGENCGSSRYRSLNEHERLRFSHVRSGRSRPLDLFFRNFHSAETMVRLCRTP